MENIQIEKNNDNQNKALWYQAEAQIKLGSLT